MSAGSFGAEPGQPGAQDQLPPRPFDPPPSARSGRSAQPGQPPPPPPYAAPSVHAQPGQLPPYAPPGQASQPLSEQFRRDYYGAPAAVVPRHTNSLAIAALCCGIGQVAVGPLAGAPAIILGIMSLKQIRESGEDGHGMAVAGITLGVIGVILTILAIIFAIVVFDNVASQLSTRG